MLHSGFKRIVAMFLTKHRQKLTLNDSIIVLASSIIIVSLYCLTQPRLSTLFSKELKKSRIENFIARIVANHEVNPWTFWEFRDLIGYGGLRVIDPPTYACEFETLLSEKMLLKQCDSLIPWSSYESGSVASLEGLLENRLELNALQALFEVDMHYDEMVVTPDLLLYGTKSRNEFILIFRKDLATMAKVNGPLHFAYRNKDFRNKYKQYSWVVITKIKTA